MRCGSRNSASILTPADLQADLAEQADFESFVELRFPSRSGAGD